MRYIRRNWILAMEAMAWNKATQEHYKRDWKIASRPARMLDAHESEPPAGSIDSQKPRHARPAFEDGCRMGPLAWNKAASGTRRYKRDWKIAETTFTDAEWALVAPHLRDWAAEYRARGAVLGRRIFERCLMRSSSSLGRDAGGGSYPFAFRHFPRFSTISTSGATRAFSIG